jgi:hypothetical protein
LRIQQISKSENYCSYLSYFNETVEEMTEYNCTAYEIRQRTEVKLNMCGNNILQASIRRQSRKCDEVKKF